MIKIFSKIKSTNLLHMIYRIDDFSARNDIISSENFLQLASLKLKKNQTFKAHQHIWKNSKNKKIIAQESWIVIKGKVEVFFYDVDGGELHKDILNVGDCSITLMGGHNYKALEENTLVYESKSGPYDGIENDKIFLEKVNVK